MAFGFRSISDSLTLQIDSRFKNLVLKEEVSGVTSSNRVIGAEYGDIGVFSAVVDVPGDNLMFFLDSESVVGLHSVERIGGINRVRVVSFTGSAQFKLYAIEPQPNTKKESYGLNVMDGGSAIVFSSAENIAWVSAVFTVPVEGGGPFTIPNYNPLKKYGMAFSLTRCGSIRTGSGIPYVWSLLVDSFSRSGSTVTYGQSQKASISTTVPTSRTPMLPEVPVQIIVIELN